MQEKSAFRGKQTPGSRGPLPLAGHPTARFEEGADRLAGGGGPQHSLNRRGGRHKGLGSLASGGAALPIMGLKVFIDKPRPGKKPIYTKATGKRVLASAGQASAGGIWAMDRTAFGRGAGRR